VRTFFEKLRGYDYLVLVSGSIIALDQVTKIAVRTQLEFGETWMPLEWLAPYARVVYWRNTGAAFGIFPAGGIVFTIVALGVVGAILYYWPRIQSEQPNLRLALALQLAGALGNLLDRLTVGEVTDWFSIGQLPVFNVADFSISSGVVVLLVASYMEERNLRNRVPDEPDAILSGEEPESIELEKSHGD
jgi:signal peptidase II